MTAREGTGLSGLQKEDPWATSLYATGKATTTPSSPTHADRSEYDTNVAFQGTRLKWQNVRRLFGFPLTLYSRPRRQPVSQPLVACWPSTPTGGFSINWLRRQAEWISAGPIQGRPRKTGNNGVNALTPRVLPDCRWIVCNALSAAAFTGILRR